MDLIFDLIHVALGTRDRLSRTPSDKEWGELYEASEKQAISSFVL